LGPSEREPSGHPVVVDRTRVRSLLIGAWPAGVAARKKNGRLGGKSTGHAAKILLAYPDAPVKGWLWIEAALNQVIVAWFLDMLASLKEQGVFRARKTTASEGSDQFLPLANRDGAA
jgi:hypothetical protein